MSTHGGDGIVIQQGLPVVKLLSATSAGAGTTRCDIKPSEGEVWDILWAVGYHDDDHAARTCVWHLDDGTTELVFYTEANLAVNTERGLYDPAYGGKNLSQAAILRVNAVHHVSFGCVDVTAGHTVKIKALVNVWRGVEPWSQD